MFSLSLVSQSVLIYLCFYTPVAAGCKVLGVHKHLHKMGKWFPKKKKKISLRFSLSKAIQILVSPKCFCMVKYHRK